MTKVYFSTNLEYLRNKKGCTQLELANKLNVAEGAIGHWEHGRRLPNSMETVGKIADYFNIGVEKLLFKDLRIDNEKLEDKIINNVRLLTPEEQEKVLAMIDLIRK